MIPLSVVIATRDEEKNIGRCLAALQGFSEIIVVDSKSRDRTVGIAQELGAKAIIFEWNGQYPKKRQWCLDNLSLKNDWLLFIDADEIVTPELKREIEFLFEKYADPAEAKYAGFFIKGRYLSQGRLLKHGLFNNKIALIDRRCMEFPVVDDIGIPGMGEMEGHYQPVVKKDFQGRRIGQVKAALIHDGLDDERAWLFRHQKYARWERGMNERNAWPEDPKPFRNFVKKLLRRSRLRPQLVFFISYILHFGFLDGVNGFRFAQKKKNYYASINK